jgi:hypothetical protein
MRTLGAIIVGAGIVSGCASVYQEPASGATATLTIRHEGEGSSYYEVYKDGGCAPNPAGTRFYTTMGTFGAPTRKIPAGQEFVLTGTWSKIGAGIAYRCSATATFVPEESKTYLAAVTANMATSRCTLGIVEEVAGGAPRPVASYRMNANLCNAEQRRSGALNGVFDNIRGAATTVTR